MQPRLSIITVCRNEGEYLQYTINSVLRQSYKHFELIVVDGFSDDNSTHFLKEISDSRIKLFQRKPYGIYDAINFGITHANGEIINILNGGDFYSSTESVSSSMKQLEKSEVDFVFSRPLYFYRDFNIVKSVPKREKLRIPFICHQSLFYEKRLHDTSGLYNLKYKFSADLDFFIKIWKTFEHKNSEESFFSVVRVKDPYQASETGSYLENKQILMEEYSVSNPSQVLPIPKSNKILKRIFEEKLNNSFLYRLKPAYWKYLSNQDIFILFKSSRYLESVFPIQPSSELVNSEV